MSLYAIEKREPGGEWEIHTYAPSTDKKKIESGLPVCIMANPDKEWRVAEYVRTRESWLDIEIQNGFGTWVPLGCSYQDEAALLAEKAAMTGAYPSAYRVVRIVRGQAKSVVKVFEPKAGV